jgi:iron(II)-dependent oxidoreductase
MATTSHTSVASVTSSRVTHESIAQLLAEARRRTLLLIEGVSEEDLRMQHDPLMGPILWDLGHIAHFEELWLVRNLEGPVEFVEMPGMYNPFEYPRRTRAELPLPTLHSLLETMAEIRERVLERLARVDFESENPLLRDGYVYQMVLQHEYQHNETMLQTLQLKRGAPYSPAARRPIRRVIEGARALNNAMVRIDVGSAAIGTDDRTRSYDNERPAHEAAVRPFWMDRTPVTNREYLAFMSAGGYARRDLWSDAGWAWLQESGVHAPKYWSREGGTWITRQMDQIAPPNPDAPVCHVCWFEAEAFARYVGKRLPTETEWEIAASWYPATRRQRTYPWGEAAADASRANVDQLTFSTASVDVYPENVSALGCYGMIGDVWEWTSSDFHGHPGFQAEPYKEYSEVFFGSEYKVLRGGSWATRPGAIRNTFRNWDYPIRRQIFSGFRCARDD